MDRLTGRFLLPWLRFSVRPADVSEQLKKELESYKEKKPWREKQNVEENKKPLEEKKPDLEA